MVLLDFCDQADLKALCDINVHHRGKRQLVLSVPKRGKQFVALTLTKNQSKGHKNIFYKLPKWEMEPGKIQKWKLRHAAVRTGKLWDVHYSYIYTICSLTSQISKHEF